MYPCWAQPGYFVLVRGTFYHLITGTIPLWFIYKSFLHFISFDCVRYPKTHVHVHKLNCTQTIMALVRKSFYKLLDWWKYEQNKNGCLGDPGNVCAPSILWILDCMLVGGLHIGVLTSFNTDCIPLAFSYSIYFTDYSIVHIQHKVWICVLAMSCTLSITYPYLLVGVQVLCIV